MTEAERPPEPTWRQKVLALNDGLKQASMPYAFGGAIALNYHREPRATLDVDINVFVSPERRDGILEVLSGLYQLSDRERVEHQLAGDGQSRTRWNSTYIDLFLANTEFHDSMASRIEVKPFDGTEIPVLSIEDLLVCKVLFNRPKDWLDVAAVASSEGRHLDRSYMTEWLTRFLPTGDERLERLDTILSPTGP